MIKRISLISILASVMILLLIYNCKNTSNGLSVNFPNVSQPIQMTRESKEHLFASYYGINS